MKLTQRPLLFATAAILLATPLSAQLNRAYLSAATGSDANSCSFSAPCRSFDKAISVSNDGAEIIVLEGGGFTPFTIDRSITIQAPPSVFVGVISAGENAVLIDAGTASIVMRGLTLTGVGLDALYGIRVKAAGSLHIENVVIDRFSYVGTWIESASEVFVIDTIIRRNANAIYARRNTAPTMSLTVHDSLLMNNGYGVITDSQVEALLSESVISGQSGRAIAAYNGAVAIVEQCRIVHNGVGMYSDASSRIEVADSTIAFNSTGISNPVYSIGHNTVRHNDSGESFAGTLSSMASH